MKLVTTDILNEKKSSIHIHPLQQIDKVCNEISRMKTKKTVFIQFVILKILIYNNYNIKNLNT